MCLVVFALDAHPAYRLVLGANRDEMYARTAAPARFWPEAPDLLAGRDLRGGGTWMGITRAGRFAAVTNLRGLTPRREGAPSRGWLVRDCLLEPEGPRAYMERMWPGAGGYDGFALLAGDLSGEAGPQMWFCSNGGAPPRRLAAGIHALSNHLLDTPWPKVVKAKADLGALLGRIEAASPRPDGAVPGDTAAARRAPGAAPARDEALVEAILRLLADRSRPDDARLPDTGVGLERERALSPIHVATPEYGTRCSTVLLVDRAGGATFVERSFAPAGGAAGEVAYRVTIG